MENSNKAIKVSQAETRQTTIRFPPSLIKAVKHEALERNMSAQALITEACRAYLGITEGANHA
jgi:predicted DNA binding CopG/RHH family protein